MGLILLNSINVEKLKFAIFIRSYYEINMFENYLKHLKLYYRL